MKEVIIKKRPVKASEEPLSPIGGFCV